MALLRACLKEVRALHGETAPPPLLPPAPRKPWLSLVPPVAQPQHPDQPIDEPLAAQAPQVFPPHQD